MADLLLLGTSTSGRAGDAGRRELAAETALAGLSSVAAVNVRFMNDTDQTGPVPVLAALTMDAPGVTGARGARKPIVSEVFDVLAREAERRGCRRFAFANGDIVVTQAAIDRIAALPHDAIALSRLDVAGDPGSDAMLLHGIDMFVVAASFWRRERRRFRPYILGEPVWDNVYTAVALSHGQGILLNRDPLIRHVRHAAARDSPFARYLHLLAARDRYYFSRWCEYLAALQTLRARGATEAEELALQRAWFEPPTAARDLVDRGRALWWAARYRFSA